MTVVELLTAIEADGVLLRFVDGELKAGGKEDRLAHWLPVLREQKAAIVEALKTQQVFTDWWVYFDQSSKWVVFPDGATQSEVEVRYPGAMAIEPIERPVNREATEEEKRILRERATIALADAPGEIKEAMAAALNDVEAALQSTDK